MYNKQDWFVSTPVFKLNHVMKSCFTSTFEFPEVLARLVGASPFTILFSFNDWKIKKKIIYLNTSVV